jgi:hypothetical protein
LDSSGRSSICSGWLAAIIGPLRQPRKPRTRRRLPEAFEVDAGGGERGRVFAVDADGEIAPPVLGEIQIDRATTFAVGG